MKPSNSFPAWKELYVHIIPCNFSSCREMFSGMVFFFVSRRAYTAELQCACTVAHFFKHMHLTRSQTAELYDNKLYITL